MGVFRRKGEPSRKTRNNRMIEQSDLESSKSVIQKRNRKEKEAKKPNQKRERERERERSNVKETEQKSIGQSTLSLLIIKN